MGVSAISGTIGGLAVALGIGAAVVAGATVASADPTGDSGSDSPSAASPSSDSPATDSTATETDTEPAATESEDDSIQDPADDPAEELDDDIPEDIAEESSDAADDGIDAVADETADAVTVSVDDELSPVDVAPAVEADGSDMDADVDTDTTSPSLPADAPAAPAQSAAMWTLAAAARRELSAEPSGSATVPVVAIEQTPPFEWLQRIPFLGPLFVTPIVAVLHQIPIVGDILHPFLGYPVQYGMPAGSPKARDVKVVSFDGTEIYVHFMPARGLRADQQAPTILNGPGLALPGGTNIDGTFLDGLLTDFAGWTDIGALRSAGYNVVTWDPRGEWKSGGQLELNSPEFEGRDVSAIISWLATLPEAQLDAIGDPRMGMTGISYGGGIQLAAAASDHRIDAIVPTITWHSLNTSLYKNQAFKSSWATLLTGALTLTLSRANPRVFPATVYGDITGMMTQADQDLLAARNPLVRNITAPTLLIQGTVDTIFSLQEADATAQILIDNAVPTKVLWFCGGHGLCVNNLFDPSDGKLIQQRTMEWLAKYVKRDEQVTTGPQFEWVDQRGQWFSSDTYPVGKGAPIVTTSYAVTTLPLIPYLGGSGFPVIPFALFAPIAINLTVPKSETTTHLVGAPELTLTYSGTGSARHIYAQLVDDTTGLVLGSLVTPIPVTLDGTPQRITVDLEPVAHTLRPGQTVTLQLVGAAGLYEKIVPSLGAVTVTSIALTLPTTTATALPAPSATRATSAA